MTITTNATTNRIGAITTRESRRGAKVLHATAMPGMSKAAL
jgi:hypothetical protein